MLEDILQSKSKTFFVFCFCFVLGIIVLSFAEVQLFPNIIFSSTLMSGFFILVFWKKKTERFITCCIFFFLLGLVRVNSIFPEADSSNLTFYHGQKRELQGFISKEPDIRGDGVQYVITLQKIYEGNTWKNVKGKIMVSQPLYPRYDYGKNISLTCDLKTPEPIEDFTYDKYLATKGIWSVCQKPLIKLIPGEQRNIFWHSIYSLKTPAAEHISLLWHEPYASFVAGLLYGYRGGLGTLSEDFNRTGVSHIVAVSGFNITIIATVLSSFFMYLLIPRKYAFYLVVLGICVFVIFTGASASVVRAGVMGILVLIARQLGRSSSIQNVLALTVTLMAAHNPMILMWDVGFQLSFLATLGLVYLSPILENYSQKIPTFLNLRESLISTMSAILFTLPLILYQFGRLSIVAPLVNLLILPFIPWLMLFGFLTLISSFFWWQLGEILAFVTYWGLFYVVRMVKFFSDLPFAAIDFRLPLCVMLFLYLFLIWSMRQWKLKHKL